MHLTQGTAAAIQEAHYVNMAQLIIAAGIQA
jgi:hypothetical protein